MRSPSSIKVLLLGSGADLGCTEEFERIEDALAKTTYGDEFRVFQHHCVRADRLIELVLRHEPDILHFSGHATPTGTLLFDTSNGQIQDVDPISFSNALGELSDVVSCVVLNACTTERTAHFLARHVDIVIAQRERIEDHAAIEFVEQFYRALGEGRSYAKACKLGRGQLGLTNRPERDSPLLVTAKRDPAAIHRSLLDDPASDGSAQGTSSSWLSTLLGLGLIAALAVCVGSVADPQVALTRARTELEAWIDALSSEDEVPMNPAHFTDKGACDQGDVRVCTKLGMRHLHEGNMRAANYYFEHACDLGDASACATLAPSTAEICAHSMALISRRGEPAPDLREGPLHDECARTLHERADRYGRIVYERYATCVLASQEERALARCLRIFEHATPVPTRGSSLGPEPTPSRY